MPPKRPVSPPSEYAFGPMDYIPPAATEEQAPSTSQSVPAIAGLDKVALKTPQELVAELYERTRRRAAERRDELRLTGHAYRATIHRLEGKLSLLDAAEEKVTQRKSATKEALFAAVTNKEMNDMRLDALKAQETKRAHGASKATPLISRDVHPNYHILNFSSCEIASDDESVLCAAKSSSFVRDNASECGAIPGSSSSFPVSPHQYRREEQKASEERQKQENLQRQVQRHRQWQQQRHRQHHQQQQSQPQQAQQAQQPQQLQALGAKKKLSRSARHRRFEDGESNKRRDE